MYSTIILPLLSLSVHWCCLQSDYTRIRVVIVQDYGPHVRFTETRIMWDDGLFETDLLDYSTVEINEESESLFNTAQLVNDDPPFRK